MAHMLLRLLEGALGRPFAHFGGPGTLKRLKEPTLNPKPTTERCLHSRKLETLNEL